MAGRIGAGIAAGLALALAASAVRGECGPADLRITGQVRDGGVDLDLAALRELPPETIVTSTVVTDGRHRFTGLRMRDLLRLVEARGETVTASALNDYEVAIPATDFRDYDVIVAYAMDGAALRRADKGPLWIVYPRDDHPELQDIRYDYRWVWQLCGLAIR